ncbi:MAG: hypothetical protein IT430_10960 [Phycisphaerales bacterium]|nr:hypothetical protein [Phycisphaerales bacterium]
MRLPAASDAASRAHFAPPRRGRVRKRYIILIIALLLLGWLGWTIYRAVTARPGPLVDYAGQMLDMSASLQPPGDNGWTIMTEALDQLQAIGLPEREDWPDDRQVAEDARSLHRVLEGPFDPERLKFELAYLEHIRASGVLERLDEFAACPRAVRTAFEGDDDAGLLAVLLPELSLARSAARARVAAMRVAAERGDMDELVRAWSHTLALTRAMSYDPTIISDLVGVAILALGTQELNRILTEHEIDEATCQRLLAVIDERPVLAPVSAVLERERLAQYDIIQHTFSDDGRGDGILLMSKLQELANYTGGGSGGGLRHPIVNVAGIVLPRRAETKRTLDEFFDLAVEQAKKTRPQREADGVDLDEYVAQLPRFQIFLRLMLPAIGRLVSSHESGVVNVEATRVMLALEMWHARHGDWPESLDQLAPDFLDSIPPDVISGQPLGYMRREPAAEDPRPYLLYSFGADGVDNGGVEHVSDRSRAVYDATLQADYVFNRLRDPVSDER